MPYIYSIVSEIWKLLKIDAGGDDKLRIQFAPPYILLVYMKEIYRADTIKACMPGATTTYQMPLFEFTVLTLLVQLAIPEIYHAYAKFVHKNTM